jgi:hypothetical protein
MEMKPKKPSLIFIFNITVLDAKKYFEKEKRINGVKFYLVSEDKYKRKRTESKFQLITKWTFSLHVYIHCMLLSRSAVRVRTNTNTHTLTLLKRGEGVSCSSKKCWLRLMHITLSLEVIWLSS